MTCSTRTAKILFFISVILIGVIACQVTDLSPLPPTPTQTPEPTPLPPIPVQPGDENPDEPVFIAGEITYTSPFFLNSINEPFVLLEDQAGFIKRDKDFVFRLEGQAIGPVQVHSDGEPLTYSLALPSIPQGTQVDVDNNGRDDPGVQVFAVAYWSNIWGGPFLEERDGHGWSTAYASTVLDPEQGDEIIGGVLVVWSPDDNQSFPSGFGSDGLLFTSDDPSVPIPAGYNYVDLNQDPFRFYKESRTRISLNEGDIAVNDYTAMSYGDAFDTMIQKVQREYPFTIEKGIDWQDLEERYHNQIERVSKDRDYFNLIHAFAQEIPDAHVNLQLSSEAFFEENGGSYGLVLKELSNGRVLVTQVFPETPGNKAGVLPGAEIITWNGKPVADAISEVTPYFGPYSTDHHLRLEQAVFLTRDPVDTEVNISFRNPGELTDRSIEMKAEIEYDSLFTAIPQFSQDPLIPPVEGEILDNSGLGYIRINTFSADYGLMARLWDHFLGLLLENQVPGLIIDVRINSGGSGSLAIDFAGYFFEEEIPLYETLYYSEYSQTFEHSGSTKILKPGPIFYEGLVAVLVSPYCVSACEGFAYALSQHERSLVVGNFPSAGAYGEVGRGQYHLPGDIVMQLPTGRHETPDGNLLLEGLGVRLDITVPITEQNALGGTDAVLDAAVEALLK